MLLLSPEGQRRLVARCQTRPIAQVAAEMGISRACASKWLSRWRRYGDVGLVDRHSTPHHSPAATPPEVITQIETWRRGRKWSASRITHELAGQGVTINRRTVARHLTGLGLGRRRSSTRPVSRTEILARSLPAGRATWPTWDVKEVGRIPDGGGWRVHGRDSDQHQAVSRAKADYGDLPAEQDTA